MNLQEYIVKLRIDPNEFVVNFNKAMRKEHEENLSPEKDMLPIRITVSSIYRYFKGKPARPKMARALVRFTNFEVDYEELVGFKNGKRKK